MAVLHLVNYVLPPNGIMPWCVYEAAGQVQRPVVPINEP